MGRWGKHLAVSGSPGSFDQQGDMRGFMTNHIRKIRWLPVAAVALGAKGVLAAEAHLATGDDWLMSVAVFVALAVMFSAIFSISGAITLPARSGPRRQLIPRSR